MEPYSIRCTTCRAKLKVRKPEAVGQICACPKCGSMVMIHPKGPSTGDTGQHAVDTPTRASTSALARQLGSSSYDSVNQLLEEDTESQHDTNEKSRSATATLATSRRRNRGNASHAESTMASTRSMSGLRIFGRAALLVIAMGVGGAIATATFFLSTRAPLGESGDIPTLDGSTSAPVGNEQVPTEPQAGASSLNDASAAASRHTDPASNRTTDIQQLVELQSVPTAVQQDGHTLKQPMEWQPTTEADFPPIDNDPPVRLAMMRTALKPSIPVSQVPDSTVSRPPPRSLDIHTQREMKIGRLQLPSISLKNMTRLISGMSTVPITLDRSVFAYGLTPDTIVSVSSQNNTVAEALDRSVSKLNLTTRVEGDHWIVEHVSASREQIKQVRHDVAQLASNEIECRALAALVELFVAPGSWKGKPASIRADDRSLVIAQSHAGQLASAIFLDQLRSARGLETSGKFDPDIVSIRPLWRAADRQLAKRITMRNQKPTRFDELLGELEEQSGLHLLVDWYALGMQGWTEATMVTSHMWQEPARDVLADVTDQLAVVTRVVCTDTICITTPAFEETWAQVAFFPIDDLLNSGQRLDEVIQLTKQAIGIDRFRDHGGIGTIGYDAPSQMLIVSLPESDLQVVDQIMSNWRSF